LHTLFWFFNHVATIYAKVNGGFNEINILPRLCRIVF